MRKQAAYRWRIGATIMAGVVFALGSFWLVQLMNRNGPDAKSDPRLNEPDYFVDNFSFVRMTPTGQPAYIVSGAKLTHRPLDDSSDIERPFVRKLSPTLPPMNVHAERGRIDQDNSRVQLNDKVLIDRAAGPGVQSMSLKTEALTVFPDADRMETALPVELLLGATRVTGVGMSANNATSQIHITQQLHMTIPPAPR